MIGVLFLSQLVFARLEVNSEVVDPPPGQVTVHRVPGEVISMEWADGRKAQAVGKLGFMRVPLTLQLASNSCQIYSPTKCTYQAGTLMGNFQIRWTAHPDPERVGKIIKIKVLAPKPSDSSFEFDFFFVAGILYKSLNDGVAQQIPKDELRCDNWNWLPSGMTSHSQVAISSLNSEIMFINPETGEFENKTIGSLSGSIWEPLSTGDGLSVKSWKSYSGWDLNPFGSIISGDRSVMTFSASQGTDSCQVVWQPNFDQLQASIDQGTILMKEQSVPYISTPDDEFIFMINALNTYFLEGMSCGSGSTCDYL